MFNSKGSFNQATIIGNVGTKEHKRGKEKDFYTLSIATTQGKGEQERTTWHKVVCFGHNANFVHEYVNVGDRVLVQGPIQKSKSQEGVWFTDIKADSIQVVSSKPRADRQDNYSQSGGYGERNSRTGRRDNDVPF